MKVNTGSLLIATIALITGLSFSACTSTQPAAPAPIEKVSAKPEMSDAEKHTEYKSIMRKVDKENKKDASFKRIDLSTPELKNWFADITYKLWDGQMSRGQFIAAGLEKFPDRSYEFETISNGLLSSQV